MKKSVEYNYYLNTRKYKYLNYNNVLDRNINSVQNIIFEGLKLYMKEIFA